MPGTDAHLLSVVSVRPVPGDVSDRSVRADEAAGGAGRSDAGTSGRGGAAFRKAREEHAPLRVRALVPALLLIGQGCVTVHDPIEWEKWRDTYPPEYSMPLADKELLIEEHLLTHHLSPEGVLVYKRLYEPFDPSGPDAYANLSDEPIWSGALAGAFAFQYAETREPGDRQLLLRVLRGLRFLHDVTGKPGLLARAVFPKEHPIPGERPDEEWRPAPEPHSRWRYRGDVSRDQYFGVLFGYAAAIVALGIDWQEGDAEIRSLMKRPATAIADHFWENGLRIVDVDGSTTTHGSLRPFFLGVGMGPNAGLLLGFHLVAHRLSGETRFRERYDEMIRRRFHKATATIKFEIFGRINYNNDNMGMMSLYALTNLEKDPEILRTYERSLAKLWHYGHNEGNAFFHLVYASRAELPVRARFDLRENLRLYPIDPRVFTADVRDHPAVERAFFDNRFGKPRNRTALPLHLRRRSSFLWKTDPFQLLWEVEDPGEKSVSGVDFLLAYWMGRFYLGDLEALPGGTTAPGGTGENT